MVYREPEHLPWDGKRVPLTFLAGYLGAGKTTLLNQLLAAATQPVAVLVNDVGEVNIDAKLIKRRHGDTIELTDGCICCSLSDGFGAAFDQLRARPTPPAHVVVELSGVAEPDRVLPWSLSAGFMLDGVVTVVDVDQLADRLADPLSAQYVEAQIDSADVIVLTKVDLASSETTAVARAMLAERAPDAPLVEANESTTPTTLLQLGASRDVPAPSPTLFDQHRTSTIAVPDPIDSAELQQLVDDLPTEVLRAKAIANAPDGTQFIVQVVGRRRTITEAPQAERCDPTDLVVISF